MTPEQDKALTAHCAVLLDNPSVDPIRATGFLTLIDLVREHDKKLSETPDQAAEVERLTKERDEAVSQKDEAIQLDQGSEIRVLRAEREWLQDEVKRLSDRKCLAVEWQIACENAQHQVELLKTDLEHAHTALAVFRGQMSEQGLIWNNESLSKEVNRLREELRDATTLLALKSEDAREAGRQEAREGIAGLLGRLEAESRKGAADYYSEKAYAYSKAVHIARNWKPEGGAE